MENTTNGNLPDKRFKFGGISVSLWSENRAGKDGSSFVSWSAKLERSYWDPKSGDWKHTNSLKESDLPKAIAALQEAYVYVMKKDDNDKTDK
jgi:hypothetical protein